MSWYPPRLDDTEIPLPFHRLQTADLTGWDGDAEAAGIIEIDNAIARLESTDAPMRVPKPPPSAPEPHRKLWLAAAAGIVIVIVGALVLMRGESIGDDPSIEPTGSFVMPDVIGLRLDAARAELAEVDIRGPSELDANGNRFDGGGRDIEIYSYVVATSPGEGEEATHETADPTVYLESCEEICPVRRP